MAKPATAPNLTVTDAAGSEDGVIALDITASLSGGGGTVLSIVISGVPTGTVLSAGIDNGDGTWTLTAGELTGLTLTPSSDSDADIALTVTAFAIKNNGSSTSTAAAL